MRKDKIPKEACKTVKRQMGADADYSRACLVLISVKNTKGENVTEKQKCNQKGKNLIRQTHTNGMKQKSLELFICFQ